MNQPHIPKLSLFDGKWHDEISGEAASGSVELITPVDHHIHVKKEEPEDENFLCKTAGSIWV